MLEVGPGDTVTFETNDCFTGQIRSEDDLVTEIDLERINSATGPVAVAGAEPGDSLVAEILDVRPIEWGVATLIPGFGQLIEQVQAPLTRLFEVRDGEIRMNDRVSFPARPMVGVVGVATDGETLSNGLAGRHGGNLDDHLHGKGARIFFPVRQPGGMFAVGDMHASMGDGEICFTGVEIAGEVDIRFDLLKGKQATWPVDRARRPLAAARDRGRLRRGAAARFRGGGAAARRRARLHAGGRVHLPVGRLRRGCGTGVQACAAVRDDRALLDPEDRGVPGAVRRVSCTPWPPPTRSSPSTAPAESIGGSTRLRTRSLRAPSFGSTAATGSSRPSRTAVRSRSLRATG